MSQLGDRNLLFGILALEDHFISRDALIAAMKAWAADKTKGMGQILREHQALKENDQAVVEERMHNHLAERGNDVARSLADVRLPDSIKRDLANIGDVDLTASLALVPAPIMVAPIPKAEAPIVVTPTPRDAPAPIPAKIASPKSTPAKQKPMPTPKRSGIPGWALLFCIGAVVFTVVIVVLVGGVVGFIVIKNKSTAPIAGADKPAPNDDGKKPLEKPEDKKPPVVVVEPPDPPKDKGFVVTPVPSDGFVSLFNGKDLTGWKKSAKFPGDWVVVHGVLTGLAAEKTMSRLQTERAYSRDFHLRAEMRISEKGAGKVGFRSPDGSLLGYEAPFGNNKQGGVRVGSLHSQVPGKGTGLPRVADAVVAPSEWFTFEAIAQGNHLVIKVNGKTTTDVSDSSTLAPGHIVLGQLGPSTFEVRKIEIKELNLAAAPPVAPADGFVPLFNGNDLTGWKTNPKASGNWRVVNGILTGSTGGTNQAYLLQPR